VGLYSGGGAYIWNEVSVSICGGLIFGGGRLFGGGAYSRKFTVFLYEILCLRSETVFDSFLKFADTWP
jgi:hypothetical protein